MPSYLVKQKATCSIHCGDCRKLEIPDKTADVIIAAHPMQRKNDLLGTSFSYTDADFEEKYRVLKDDAFLVEIVPEETADNFRYLYQIKESALKAGFAYYAAVPFNKGCRVSTNARQLSLETILFFTKGRPCIRCSVHSLEPTFGTRHRLPSIFDFGIMSIIETTFNAERPIALYERIIEEVSNPGDVVLDQFGVCNGAIAQACLSLRRHCITYMSSALSYTDAVNALSRYNVFIPPEQYALVKYTKDESNNIFIPSDERLPSVPVDCKLPIVTNTFT